MNLLSRRSVLAIAAVVDVALHSRSAPVQAELATRRAFPRATWRHCSRGSSTR